jgi:hypothetical protein
MKHNSCINLQAQSSVAASVAIAVAAVTSGVATRPLPPAGYGPVSAEHLDFLKKSGFSEACLNTLAVFSSQNPDGFAILAGSSFIEFITSGTDTFSCKNPPALLVPPMAVKPRKGFEGTLFITENPLAAILSVTLGISSVSVTQDGWLDPSVDLPLPNDLIYRTQAAKPDARLLALAEGREVIFDSSFGLYPQLGHSLKYHTACKAFVWQASPDDLLTPALLISADQKTLDRCKNPLRRGFVSYAYEETAAGKMLKYHYPLFYRASDEFIPCLEKEIMTSVTDKDGNEEWVMKRVLIDGVPNCRIRRTMIVTQNDGGYISLDRNSGSAQVIEEMEGVTSTRREVTFNLQPSDYTVEALIAKDFTKTLANKIHEWRSFLAAQKGQHGHPIDFGTYLKGYFGLRQENGEMLYPAGHIAENRILTKPGLLSGNQPTIVPLGAKAGALSRKGTPEAWRRIMRIMLKNSSIAALMGFGSSILIHPFVTGIEPGMIVLVGASGRGKTTAMRAIASMISEPSKPSKPGSYIMTFRTTENGLEGRLEAKNHCPSLIDEIGAASTGMNWSAAGYMIANGIGKLRMNSDSSMRETKTWSTQTIASGEESFASKMNANGQAERGGILFRVVDLHLEGVPFWEHLEAQVRDGSTGEYQPICEEYGPGAVTATQVMDTIFSGLDENHGHAWDEMVESMLDDDYRKKAADRLTGWLQTFTSKLDDRTEIIVHRRSAHLASAMAGLELILDTLGDELPADERQSIIDGAAAWVETYLWRAGLADGVVTEEGAIYERVLEKITLNPSRFYYADGEDKTRNIKQYWGVNHGADGVTLFIDGLRDICKEMGEDYKRVRHALVDQADDKKWVPQNARPAYGAVPMRGLKSPNTFHLLGFGFFS